MSTNVNYGYIGGSSNVNVDIMIFSEDVQCLITMSITDFIDKNDFRRQNFLIFSTSFQIIIEVENIQQKSLNKMRYVSSEDRAGGTFYNVDVDIM